MTVYYAEEGFQPTKSDIALVGLVEYWEGIAAQAIDFFTEKEWFMNWVCSHYYREDADTHRFTASACWDIVKLGSSDGE